MAENETNPSEPTPPVIPIDWDESDARDDAAATHEPFAPAAPTAAVTTAVATPGSRWGRWPSLKVAAAIVLVLAVGGLGFVFGHYVVTPPSSSAAPRISFPSFPTNGSGSTGFGGFGGSGSYGGFGGFGGFGGSGSYGGFPSAPSTVSPASSAADAAAAKIAKSVDPGLVDITSNLSYQGSTAEGTGMILTSDGLVLTNNHVIEGASSLSARDVATGVTYQATVVGYDLSADVALLQLTDASGLTTVTTGNSNNVTSGETVVGIGNAGGTNGTPSYAAGTVTALDQSITASDEGSPAGAEHLSGLIETDADIQPGDSGGPLVNAKGHVIGMDTAGASTNGGFGFQETGSSSAEGYAIPIDTALDIVKSIEKGDATSAIHVGGTAFLGIEIDADSATTTTGVTIAEAIAGEPAANAGLVAGDVVTSLDGQAVTSGTGLQSVLLTLRPGESVAVGYTTPNGAQQTVEVTLSSGPAQ